VEPRVILKQDIAAWLKGLADEYEVIAPVTEDGVTRFRSVSDPSLIDLGPTPSKSGLRECFTPETETLFEYKLEGLGAEVTAPESIKKNRLIFGARACDAAALKYVDAVYSNVEPVDVPYFDRREHTFIVGVFCDKPSWACFCTEVGDFLANPINTDAFLYDLGDKYYAEALTPEGEALLGSSHFTAATDADRQAIETLRQSVLSKLPAAVDHAAASQSYDWDDAMWTRLAEKCIGCGACTFLCPTCHCFDIMECAQGRKGTRFRCWDNCQFDKFTLMGHGHNPRPSRRERTRQRVFHKFKYSPERYGILGCVGCGRCISTCPVNIDIRQVITEIEA